MYGAILGDIIGSPYEFDKSGKIKDFPLFIESSRFTDDSVMTIAVADALLHVTAAEDDDHIRRNIIRALQYWGQQYPDIGYGRGFLHWLSSSAPQPYGSWGNGSAMRVSSAGWLFEDRYCSEDG